MIRNHVLCPVELRRENLAEGEGFEPSCRLRDHRISNARRLASLATFHVLATREGFEPPTFGLGNRHSAN